MFCETAISLSSFFLGYQTDLATFLRKTRVPDFLKFFFPERFINITMNIKKKTRTQEMLAEIQLRALKDVSRVQIRSRKSFTKY